MKQHLPIVIALVALASLPVASQRGGPGGMPGGEERKLLAQFDKNGDKRLNAEERKAALAFVERRRAPIAGSGAVSRARLE